MGNKRLARTGSLCLVVLLLLSLLPSVAYALNINGETGGIGGGIVSTGDFLIFRNTRFYTCRGRRLDAQR